MVMSTSLKRRNKLKVKEFNKLITKGETVMDQELFKKYFIFQMPTAMLKAYIIQIVKRKKNHLINVIKSGLSYLKDEIKEMSEGEIKIEKPFETVNTVEKIPEFNRKTQKDKD